MLKTLAELSLEGSSFSRAKPLLLLTFLAIEGRTTRRELADLFFLNTKNPRDSLSSAIKYLKKENEDLISVDGDALVATVDCDAALLLIAFEKRNNALVQDLYKGSFLKGLELKLGEDLEDWVYGTRELIANKVRQSYLNEAQTLAKQAEFSEAALQAEKAYFLAGAPEPDPELLSELYALLLAGKSTRAVEVKQEAEAFGITLFDSVAQAQAQFDFGQKQETSIMTEGASFVGRIPELEELNGLLLRDDVRLLTLLGSGGMGKTRLARKLIETTQNKAAFKEGVYFVQLESLSNPDMIPAAIATTLELRLNAHELVLQQVINFVANKRMLLILDNFEHLIEGFSLCSSLLNACPKLKLVVSSREKLNIQQEWVYKVQGLQYPQEMCALDEAKHYDAIKLFVSRAQKQDHYFKLNSENHDDIQSICCLLDGLPLGLELAASWLRALTVEDVRQELEANFAFLETDSRDLAERHRSLEATFNYSWELLTELEQTALKACSIFRGGFSRQAIKEIAGVSLLTLVKLIDKSMLAVDDLGRYSLHPLIQQFIYGLLLLDSTHFDWLKTQHKEFFHRQFQIVFDSQSADKDLLRVISLDWSNIIAAWEYVRYLKDLEVIYILSPLMRWFCNLNGNLAEGKSLLENGLEGLDFSNLNHYRPLSRIIIDLALIDRELGNVNSATQLLDKASSLLANLPNSDVEIMDIASTQASLFSSQGNHQKALLFWKKSLKVSQKLKHARYIINNQAYVASAYARLGNYDEAERRFSDINSKAKASGNIIREINSLMHLARIAFIKMDIQKSIKLFHEGANYESDASSMVAQTPLLYDFTNLYLSLNEPAKCEDVIQKHMKLAIENEQALEIVKGKILQLRLRVIQDKETPVVDEMKDLLSEICDLKFEKGKSYLLLAYAEYLFKLRQTHEASELLIYLFHDGLFDAFDKQIIHTIAIKHMIDIDVDLHDHKVHELREEFIGKIQ